MEKASQQAQLNIHDGYPHPTKLFLTNCSGITSEWTKLGHLMILEPITEPTGLKNFDWSGFSHMPVSELMGRVRLTQITVA